MRTLTLLTLGSTLLCLAVLEGCDDNTPVCIPGTFKTDCSCNTGANGYRVCTDDGLDHGECLCGSPDGGMKEDGGS